MREPVDRRIERLVAESARQRRAVSEAFAPWASCARRIDERTTALRRHAGRLGFAAGVGLGLLVALRPRLLLFGARAASLAIPPLLRSLWIFGWRRDIAALRLRAARSPSVQPPD